ncbi:FAD:protein FMN transferase [Pseudemcibacter aquimaris]|uniref:FAD:protein FMN transferase n=1 Tax=Pseudemcibacter aquimaris TaxID=2857064 RepID=UPI0020135013|nr:FAD:protein FMN transferase [Pseudemcibacter aquimaris]MCC3860382.1 FAD:protein FMN transferase [Pseudemcibacter aquimaris]WDU57708.1 FAD:protein FMN transferase [Pseudemcibacter aquimaris]
MDQTRRDIFKAFGVTMGVFLLHGCDRKSTTQELFIWEGYALGADSSIQLYGNDKFEFDAVIQDAVELIKRLEKIFSLYDPTSEISRLNEAGKIDHASPEMIDLINASKEMSRITKGAFDITVQPLWNFYDRYFAGDRSSDFDVEVSNILPLIGSDKIHIEGSSVSFERKGMAISSNGIAQGYITDQVLSLLNDRGYNHALVDIGEYGATGAQYDGSPWRIGLLDPFDQISVADVVDFHKGGLATSGGYGTVFEDSGENHHIFNPATGLSTRSYASVTVLADDATTADALSTAFSAMTMDDIKRVSELVHAKVRLTMRDGEVVWI